MNHPAGLLGLVLLCAALPGCSGDGLVNLKGTVSLDGKPLERGTIRFVAADGTGPSAETVIQAGAYSVDLPAGKKRVSILGYKKIGEHHVTGPDSPLIDDLEQIVPPQYNEQTTLERDVPTEGQASLDFELTTSP